MDWLEQELKAAMSRKDPPADFADRVMQAAKTGPRPAPVRIWPRWLAAAAVVMVMAGGAVGYREYRGEMAKQQVMQAFRIASVKVNQIQTHVREAAQ